MSDVARIDRGARRDTDPTEKTSGLAAFAARFLKAPTVVGSPFPSSAGMVHRLLSNLRWQEIGTFVEFGPGTGAFTRYALQHLRPDARLIALDTEKPFIDLLRKSITDPRLVAVEGSALDVADIARAAGASRIDCVLSGLPFSALPEVDRGLIVHRSAAMMSKAGVFLAYQVRRAIERPLSESFARVERHYHFWNMPPCHLYRATSPKSSADISADDR
ncbi:MAG: methyltransferase [Sphingobium sp.]|nr:methyltransferase [Sphingobium sp.]